MRRLSPTAVVVALALVPVLACGQSGASPQAAQAVQQALPAITKGVAAQAWSGTITITQGARNAFTQDDHVMHTSNGTQTASNAVTIKLTKGLASADVHFELHENTDQLDHYDGYDLIGNVKEDTLAVGTNGKDASIKVSINDNGTYEIEYRAPGVDGRWDKVETSRTQCAPGNSNCQNTSSRNTDSAKVTNQGFMAGSVSGTVSRSTPNVLAGSSTEPWDIFSGGTPGKTTITWNLSR
jgi:hypothetical protein